MILYNPSNNNFSVYDGVNEVTNLPIVGIRKITSDNTILKYNELGVYNDTLAIGDGINTFKNLAHYNNINDITTLLNTKINISDIIDNVTSTDTNKPLSANQGKNLMDHINLIAKDITMLETTKISASDVIDNLTSTIVNLPLSANQGKTLKGLIDNKVDKVTGKGLSSNDFTDSLLS